MRKQLINHLCAGNKVFVRYQAQGGFNPTLVYALNCFG